MPRGKRNATPKTLLGADEFAGPDAEKEAIEKIAAARAAATEEEADKKKGDNGGPIMDQDAWRRACVEYSAEMLGIEDLQSEIAEHAQRISSIRKIGKKHGVDWDLVKRYYEDHKRIRKGAMGAMVTEERRYRELLRFMESPLGTQTSLWDVAVEASETAPKRPALDAELQGQHAWSNNEPISNNPFTPGSEEFVQWESGHNNAMAAHARKMAPGGEASH